MPRPAPLWKLPRAEQAAVKKARREVRAARKDHVMNDNDAKILADMQAAMAEARGEDVIEAGSAGLLSAGFEPADILAVLGEMHTLAADTTGYLLDVIKQTPKPWQQMSCGEQEALIENLTVRSGALVRGIVRTIAAGGRQTILAEVKKVTFGDKGVEAVMTCSRTSEHRHTLADSQGLEVLIVVADAAECFEGDQPRPDAPASNQPELDFDGAGVEPDPDDCPLFDRTASGQDVRAERLG